MIRNVKPATRFFVFGGMRRVTQAGLLSRWSRPGVPMPCATAGVRVVSVGILICEAVTKLAAIHGRRLLRACRLQTISTAIALSAGLAACPVDAQVVRGSVTERGSDRTVAGVLLSIIDDRGGVAVAALSDENGAFELRAPAPGRYVLEAKRIGLRQVRFPAFTLAEGEAIRHDVVLDPIPVLLDRVRVTGRSSCVERPQENERTAALWEDARAALRATVLTRQTAGANDSVVRFTRKLDVNTWKVLFEQRRMVLASLDRPFQSLAAQDLSSSGYVRVNTDGTTDYFAPDADVLLSDAFLTDHCFKVEQGTGDHLTHVGLAFQPVRGRQTPDIRGVLWLDKATAELRSLDFTYTWLPFDLRSRDYGGTVSFFRTASGRWIVWSWRIRTPEFGFERWAESVSGERIPLPRSSTPRVVRIQEEGGAVPIGSLIIEAGSVAGTVMVDSVTKRPVAGTTVGLVGTAAAVITDENGEFAITDVSPGSYTISLRHPVLDSLGLNALSTSVDVARGVTAILRLYFPSMVELSQRLCADTAPLDRTAIVRFIVVDSSSGLPLQDAPVVVARRTRAIIDGQTVDSITTIYDGMLDTQGAYVACGIPAGDLVQIESRAGDTTPWSSAALSSAGAVGWQLIRVRRPESR